MPLYGLLAGLLPLSILVSITILCADLKLFPVIPALIAAALSEFGAALYYRTVCRTPSDHSSAHVRGACAVFLLSYGFFSFFFNVRDDAAVLNRFIPHLANTIPALLALYGWTYILMVYAALTAREAFVRYAQDHSRADLSTALRDGFIKSSEHTLKKAARLYCVQVLCVGIGSALKKNSGGGLSFLCIALVLFATIICGLFRIFSSEERCASEGVVGTSEERTHRIHLMLITVALLAGAAFLLTARRPLLPLSLLLDFLAWLFALLFREKQQQLPPWVPPAPLERPYEDVKPVVPLEWLEQREPWSGWRYIQYGFIGIGILLFVWFMIKPFFSRFTLLDKAIPLHIRIVQAAYQWWTAWIHAIRSFFTFKKDNRSRALDSPAYDTVAAAVLKSYTTARNKKIKATLNLFARLIVWGNAVVPWKNSDAPLEYCDRLALHYSEQRKEIMRCGALFEQALYSEHPLSQKEQHEFKQVVESLISSSSA
ncbi:MAG: DUF4129 domain-containing protein [Treponema sp.]|jgi:hypothetical protein|nr:DUF4129 domain-containing protein [Treponema sp.]